MTRVRGLAAIDFAGEFPLERMISRCIPTSVERTSLTHMPYFTLQSLSLSTMQRH